MAVVLIQPQGLATEGPSLLAATLAALLGQAVKGLALTRTVLLAPSPLPVAGAPYTWVWLTSPQAAVAFAPHYRAWATVVNTPANTLAPLVATVGQATARQATQEGLPVAFCPAPGTNGALAAAQQWLKQQQQPTTVLWPCSALAANTLPQQLTALGHTVKAWPLYTLEPLPAAEAPALQQQLGQPTALVFTSTSSVAAWQALGLYVPPHTPLVALGPSTAKALKALALTLTLPNPLHESQTPTAEGLAQCLASYKTPYK